MVDELTCSTTGWSASNCLLGSDAFGVYDDEAVEGRDAFLQKREPDYGRFPATSNCR
jgi:1,4-dihydroxy-2-naphthoyl-CoA synthase